MSGIFSSACPFEQPVSARPPTTARLSIRKTATLKILVIRSSFPYSCNPFDCLPVIATDVHGMCCVFQDGYHPLLIAICEFRYRMSEDSPLLLYQPRLESQVPPHRRPFDQHLSQGNNPFPPPSP